MRSSPWMAFSQKQPRAHCIPRQILEWSPSPEHALRWSIYLNDRYSLDGRDPNGYVGCMWSICGTHDQVGGCALVSCDARVCGMCPLLRQPFAHRRVTAGNGMAHRGPPLPPRCQGWKERPVFGKIRYMNYNGCKRKFKIAEYVARCKRYPKTVTGFPTHDSE